jgi:hypothetical protein
MHPASALAAPIASRAPLTLTRNFPAPYPYVASAAGSSLREPMFSFR